MVAVLLGLRGYERVTKRLGVTKFEVASKVLVVTVLLGLTVVANAADIPQATPYKTAPVAAAPVIYNWTGFYIGGMGGGGWLTGNGFDFKGGFGGGTIGVNAQFSNFVVGAEFEAAGSNIRNSFSFPLVSETDTLQAFGSATARAGVALDNILIYGKGGYSAVSYNVKGNSAFFGATNFTQTYHGYTLGAGVEYGFTPNWSAKVEYLWAKYPDIFTSGVQTVKVGINYRFGWGGPVVARY